MASRKKMNGGDGDLTSFFASAVLSRLDDTEGADKPKRTKRVPNTGARQRLTARPTAKAVPAVDPKFVEEPAEPVEAVVSEPDEFAVAAILPDDSSEDGVSTNESDQPARCKRCHIRPLDLDEDSYPRKDCCQVCYDSLREQCRLYIKKYAKKRLRWANPFSSRGGNALESSEDAGTPEDDEDGEDESEDEDEPPVRRCANDGCDSALPPETPQRVVFCAACLVRKSEARKKSPRESRGLGERAVSLHGELTAGEMDEGRSWPTFNVDRPRIRRDCLTQEAANRNEERAAAADGRWPVFDRLGDGCNAERPCPFVSCKYHLYTDIGNGLRADTLKLNFPRNEVWELRETCALDLADRNGVTLEEVGELMNLTRERVRQLETQSLIKIKIELNPRDLGLKRMLKAFDYREMREEIGPLHRRPSLPKSAGVLAALLPSAPPDDDEGSND